MFRIRFDKFRFRFQFCARVILFDLLRTSLPPQQRQPAPETVTARLTLVLRTVGFGIYLEGILT